MLEQMIAIGCEIFNADGKSLGRVVSIDNHARPVRAGFFRRYKFEEIAKCIPAEEGVKNPLPAPKECRFCGGEVRLLTHEQHYGSTFSDWPYLYVCASCRASVGVHNGTKIPLGTLADKPTRDARKHLKTYFNCLWRNPKPLYNRNEAYQWLANKLGIPLEECHIGWFDADRCMKAQEIVMQRFKEDFRQQSKKGKKK